MNLTIASGSAIAVLLAVALTGSLALGMIGLYLYHQRRQSTNDHPGGFRSPDLDRERTSLTAIIATSWEIEDALSLIEIGNGVTTDVPLQAIVSAVNRGGGAIVDLGAGGGPDELTESYRAMRRSVLALDAAQDRANGDGIDMVSSDALAELKSRVENVERLARARLTQIESAR